MRSSRRPEERRPGRAGLAGRVAALVCACAGLGLLGLALAGDVGGLGTYEGRAPRPGERYDAALASRARSVDALVAEARSRRSSDDPEAVMLSLYATVADRFAHSGGARHVPATNWVAWASGKAVRPLSMLWTPEDMVAHGDALVCSQSSYLLLTLARREGVPARHVGLHGHVVMEAWYDDDWHMFDPDGEVVARTASGEIPSVEELALDPALLRASYVDDNAQYVDVIASRENNTYMSYPEGAWFGWRPQVLALAERVMHVLKYALPLLLIAAGVALGIRRPR